MKMLDHTDGTLQVEPTEGNHTVLLTVTEAPRAGGSEASFALRPDSAAALAGLLQAWVAERSKDGLFALAMLMTLAGCGASGPTAPEPVTPAVVYAAPVRVPWPGQVYGAFAQVADVPEAAAHAGNVVVVIPSYAEDAARATAALRATGKVAILSAHHVFGGPRSGWAQGWAQTKAWAAGMPVAAVLVVDEPLHNGIPAADRDAAIALVRADGYATMTTEGVDRAIAAPRPPVDVYGVTRYWWPGVGSWTYDRCAAAYGDRPQWDLVIGQAYDDYRFEV